MKLCHRYGGWFQFVKVLKCNSLHRNGLATREVLLVNFFNNYLTSFCIIMCAFAEKLIASTHKHVILFICTLIFPRDLNMWQIKIQFINFCNLIFWMKTQNAEWFQYNTFLCCNFCFLSIFYIHAWSKCFAMIREHLFVQRTRAYIFVVMKSNELNIHIILIINFCVSKKTSGHSLKQFNTHDQFGNLIYFSVKSHILSNAESLVHG